MSYFQVYFHGENKRADVWQRAVKRWLSPLLTGRQPLRYFQRGDDHAAI
jgi:hypothetical protein